jgi:hypothetical protein
MCCALCKTSNQSEFTTEMMIHFSDIRNIDRAGGLAFPKVLVCLDCGFSEFRAPETVLRVLGKGIVASAAAY